MAISSYQFRLSHLFVTFFLASLWLVSVRWGNFAVTALWMTFFVGLLCVGTARAVALTDSRRVFWSVFVLVTAGYSGAAIGLDVGGTSLPGEAAFPTTNLLLWAKELAVQQDKKNKVKTTPDHNKSRESELELIDADDPFGGLADPISETSDVAISETNLADGVADWSDWPLRSHHVEDRDYAREILMVEIGQTGIALLLGYLNAIYALGLHNANSKKSVKPTLEN